ncbi:heme exporter protein CcmD [Salmonella enterica]
MSPAFSSWSDFFAMGGYAFFVWLAVAMTVAPLALLALHTVLQRRAILRGVAQQLSLIHISEPTRLRCLSYAVFCLKKKKKKR